MKSKYEALATIALILVIGLCLLQIAGVSASFHERLSDRKDNLDSVRIAASYYLTKLRHYDSEGELRIEGDKIYISEYGVSTCIFVENGELLESIVVDGVEHSADTSFKITDIDSVSLEIRDFLVTVRVRKNDKEQSVSYLLKAGKR